MAPGKIIYFSTRILPLMILFIILIGTLDLMSSAIQNTDNANSGQYSSLLFINGIGLFILISLIAANFFKMAQQCRYRVPGAKLTLRMGLVFVVVALVPVSVVYYYSLQFLNRGIDSWFDVRIEEGLQNALDLSRASLDLNIAEHKRQTEEVIESVVQLPENMLAINLGEWRAKYNASEMTLFTNTGKAVASSNVNQGQILPTRLSEETLFHLGLGNDYFKLETIREEGMHIRIIVHDPSGGSAMLQAIFPVPKRIETLADSVKTVFTKHRERVFLHNALKDTFTVTLSLVLLFSILFAVWAAFYSAKRMVAPILDLVEGTRAVSAGIYDKQLVSTRNDDLGGLVQAFNDMTKRLAQARNESQRAQQKVESQRAYLQVVLSNLSSGVITFDLDLRFRTSNDAASEILGIDLKLFRRSSIQKIVQVYPSYSNLFWPLQEHMITSEKEWSEQLEIFGAGKRQVLICRSTALPDGAGIQSGYVVVFDDITNLIQAQRNSAWGEVARRLAHEIKNPLTPIQLSAERLRRKLLVKIEGKDATILEKSTNTIIQQVEAMKEMVNAFSEYAKTPQMNIVPLDVNQLLEDVVELYQHKKDVVIELKANRQELTIKADTVRLRQVFHNLIKNALEALDGVENAKIEIVSNCTESNSCQFVEIDFIDNGPGIADNLINQLFEPYMTTKTKGTGLGLAIVKKIIEEHGGVISASNSDGGGAFIAIRLPVNSS